MGISENAAKVTWLTSIGAASCARIWRSLNEPTFEVSAWQIGKSSVNDWSGAAPCSRCCVVVASLTRPLATLAQSLNVVAWSGRIEAKQVKPGEKAKLLLTGKIDAGWHLYSLTAAATATRHQNRVG